MFNSITLIGRIGTEPVARFTQNQSKVVKFSMATTDVWTDRDGNRQEKTTWHSVECWGRLADRVERWNVGDLVFIQGSIDYSEWEKDGMKQKRAFIKARMGLVMRPKFQGKDTPATAPRSTKPDTRNVDLVDDIPVPKSDLEEIPF